MQPPVFASVMLCKICGGRIVQLPRSDASGQPTYAHVDHVANRHDAQPGAPSKRRS